MHRYLLYQYNDMAHALACANPSSCVMPQIAAPYEGLAFILNKLFLSWFAVPLGPNLLFLFFALLSLVSTYYFFVTLHRNKLLAIVFSLAYTFSVFTLYRLFSYTYTLFPVFLFPLHLTFLIKKKYKLVPIMLVLSFLLSVYYSYYLFVLTFVYFGYIFFVTSDKTNIARTFLIILLGSLSVIYLLTGRFLTNNIPALGNYMYPKETATAASVVYRPIEDWYSFAVFPWYFVIPPKSSVFFEGISRGTYKAIENTGYYLARNYESTEMAGLYLGWHAAIGILVAIVLVCIKKYRSVIYKVSGFTADLRMFLAMFCTALLLTLPPSFTINGVELYTPSYILYQLIAPLRVQTRWAVVFVLLALAILYLLLAEFIERTKWQRTKIALPLVFLIVNFWLTAVKIPIIDTTDLPEEVKFVKNISGCTEYATYPTGSYKSIFWSTFTGKKLVNAEGAYFGMARIPNLATEDGIKYLQQTNSCVLIFSKNAKSGDVNKDFGFFLDTLYEPVYTSQTVSIFSLEGIH